VARCDRWVVRSGCVVADRQVFRDSAWVPLCGPDLVAVREAGSADVPEVIEEGFVVRADEIPDARVRAAIGCEQPFDDWLFGVAGELSRRRVLVVFWRLV